MKLNKFGSDKGNSFMPRSWWNRLIDYVVGNIVVGPGLQIFKQGNNICINLSPSISLNKLSIAKVTGYASANGGTNNKLKVKRTDPFGSIVQSSEEEVWVWMKGTTAGVITNDSVQSVSAVGDLIIIELLPILIGGAGAANGKFDAWAYRPGGSSGVSVKTFKCESLQTVSGKTIMRGKIQKTDGSLESTNIDVYLWSYPAEGAETLANVFPQIAIGKFYPIMQMQEKWISGTAAIRWFVVGLVGGTCAA